MANTTFNGPVRAEGGFKQISKNSSTGAITDNTTIDSSGNLSVGGTSTLTGSIIANSTTNAIGTLKVQAFGASLAATNGGTTQYTANDILVEIGALDATLPTTFANSVAPTHFLIEKDLNFVLLSNLVFFLYLLHSYYIYFLLFLKILDKSLQVLQYLYFFLL